jgi:hypothetical protein
VVGALRLLRRTPGEDVAPEARAPLQPVGQAPDGLALGEPPAQGFRFSPGLPALPAVRRQQQPRAQEREVRRHDQPVAQPGKRHPAPGRRRRLQRGAELLGEVEDGQAREVQGSRMRS